MRWQSQGLRYHNATIRMIWCPVDTALTRNQTEGHDQEFPTRVHSVSSEISFPNHVSETCKLMLKMSNAGILPKAVKPCQQRQEPRACRTAQPRSPSRNRQVVEAQAPSTFLSSPFDWVLSAGRASQKCPESKLRRKNIAKDTTDPRVEFISQDHSSQILSILQFQNLNNAFTSKSQPNISILTKP